MRAPTAAALLDAWDQGHAASPVGRALALLAAADPTSAPATLAALPVGERDGRLLTLREAVFGARVAGRAACPACALELDLAFLVSDIRVSADAARADTFTLAAAGYAVAFRLPTSQDLLALAGLRDVEMARQMLLTACIVAVQPPDDAALDTPLPAAVVAALVAHMAAADPQADVQLALVCPACVQQWQESFDIVSFLWAELDAWAGRLLREVHSLATAYGWGEAAILALSPRRRQYYLELVRG